MFVRSSVSQITWPIVICILIAETEVPDKGFNISTASISITHRPLNNCYRNKQFKLLTLWVDEREWNALMMTSLLAWPRQAFVTDGRLCEGCLCWGCLHEGRLCKRRGLCEGLLYKRPCELSVSESRWLWVNSSKVGRCSELAVFDHGAQAW